MASMAYEDVDIDAVADLAPEDVEAREVFDENTVEAVNNPFLNFILGGGDISGRNIFLCLQIQLSLVIW